MTTYIEKLRDPRWQRRRLEVMARTGFSCEQCGDDSSTLNVHHRRYFKGQEPWDYPDALLVCLCESCHRSEHSNGEILKDILSMIPVWDPSWRGLHTIVLAFIAATAASQPQRDQAEGFADNLQVDQELFRVVVGAIADFQHARSAEYRAISEAA